MLKLKKKLFYTLRKYGRQSLRDLAKWMLLASSGLLTRRVPLPMPKVDGGKKHLVILRPDGIGDFVVFARELHRYRKLYPAAHWKITLIGNKVWQALAEDWNAALYDKWFDYFLPIDRGALKRSVAYRHSIALQLKTLCCDELIYPVHSRDIWGCVFAQWVNSTVKTAPFGDSANLILAFKYFFDRSFTRLIAEKPGSSLEIDRADHFLRALGDSTPSASCFTVLPNTKKMAEEKEQVLSMLGLRVDGPYLILFPGAAWNGKRWPSERFIQLGREKRKKSEIAVLVCGGGDEAQLGQIVAAGIGVNAHNLAGKTTLVGLAALLAGAKESVSNDTSAVHLSAAFKRPTTCIMCGGHWGRFWPYGDLKVNQTISHRMPCFGCGWECRYKEIPVPCIAAAGHCSD